MLKRYKLNVTLSDERQINAGQIEFSVPDGVGDWVSGNSYVVGNIVSYGGGSYMCTNAIAPSTESPVLDTDHWQQIAEKGAQGEPGHKGEDGQDGAAATIQIGEVITGEPGTNASVENTGTENAAILKFTIPRGNTGEPGQDGEDGTIVEANPTEEGTENLTKIKIDNTVYKLPTGGGGAKTTTYKVSSGSTLQSVANSLSALLNSQISKDSVIQCGFIQNETSIHCVPMDGSSAFDIYITNAHVTYEYDEDASGVAYKIPRSINFDGHIFSDTEIGNAVTVAIFLDNSGPTAYAYVYQPKKLASMEGFLANASSSTLSGKISVSVTAWT